MKRLQVKNVGPIEHADVTFGDLTILVGPQASGKSIFVQLYKLIDDAPEIRYDLKKYGFDWTSGGDSVRDFCSLYFGGGMEGVLREGASVVRNGRHIDFKRLTKKEHYEGHGDREVFLVPAQRVLVLQDGWPKPFTGYSSGDPYCMRAFSEVLRRTVTELDFGQKETIFPSTGVVSRETGSLISQTIYVGATLEQETQAMRKRVVLKPPGSGTALPNSAWSAGQREFTPLLLGLYWLRIWDPAPESAEDVVVEEPEMGLHPQAIVSFGLLVLELMQKGHKVILSTHSPVILDLVWALRELSHADRKTAKKALLRIFGIARATKNINAIFDAALEKSYRTYFFNRTPDGVVTEDISTLDPGDENEHVSGWGGLSGFSGRIAQIVGEALSQ